MRLFSTCQQNISTSARVSSLMQAHNSQALHVWTIAVAWESSPSVGTHTNDNDALLGYLISTKTQNSFTFFSCFLLLACRHKSSIWKSPCCAREIRASSSDWRATREGEAKKWKQKVYANRKLLPSSQRFSGKHGRDDERENLGSIHKNL